MYIIYGSYRFFILLCEHLLKFNLKLLISEPKIYAYAQEKLFFDACETQKHIFTHTRISQEKLLVSYITFFYRRPYE